MLKFVTATAFALAVAAARPVTAQASDRQRCRPASRGRPGAEPATCRLPGRSGASRISRPPSICGSSTRSSRWCRRPSPTRSCPARSCSSAAAIGCCIRRRSGTARWCRRSSRCARHDVRPRLAHQGGRDDDQRDDAGGARQAAAERPGRDVHSGFERYGKADITIRHLLTHMSGLRPDLDLAEAWTGRHRDRASPSRRCRRTARPALRLQRHQLLPARRHRPPRERADAGQVRQAGDLRSARDEGHVFLPAAAPAAHRADRSGRHLQRARRRVGRLHRRHRGRACRGGPQNARPRPPLARRGISGRHRQTRRPAVCTD